MSIRDHLQDIYDRNGKLTPAMVVEEARDPEHPLHGEFDWDDASAGEAHRRTQAHELIRRVRLKYRSEEGREKDVRYFQAVRTEAVEYHYVPSTQVVQDPFMTRLVLNDMEREWRQLRRRYEAFEEFWHMVKSDLDGGSGDAVAA